MPAIWEVHRTVQSQDIDDQGIVNNVEYLRWLQDAAIEHSTAQGWTKERYLEAGAVFVVQSHHIEYVQPALLGDELRIQTWVCDFSKFTSLRKYLVTRAEDNSLVARAATNWAFVSWPKRIPKRFLPELINAFVLVPAEQEPQAKSR